MPGQGGKNKNRYPNCILIEDLECTDCGACDFCDLNPKKICDNCGTCLGDADYRGIIITEIKTSSEEEGKEENEGKSD